MPSWSASDRAERAGGHPAGRRRARTDIDAARKVLDELFPELPADENPPQPEH